MASIFLSYAREDMHRARAFAKALERAGHSVWWDRQIRGGSEFAREIEDALKRADVVLVLWSETSVRSAWVRDEAAEGRDSGRLLPVMLDDCVPPLGFRQIHSISIDSWSGRGKPPNFADILAAVGKPRADQQEQSESRSAPPRRPLIFVVAAIVLLVVAAIGAWSFFGKPKEGSAPVLAVLPFSDLSPGGDKAYFAEGVAEAILTVLAKDPGIRVIGRSTAEQLQSAGENSDQMRRALGVTHVLEGSARSAGDQLRMSVRLINAADGRQLWAEEYQRRLDNVFEVQDQIGRAVAQRLKGSFASAAKAEAQLTSADVYTLYLAGRAKMRDRRLPSLKAALADAERVIAADPNYAPGHALYAELVWHLSAENYGTIPHDRAREVSQRHARRAIQLAPHAAEGYAALGVSAQGRLAEKALSKAIELDPSRAELRLWLSDEYELTGRNDQAFNQLITALELDPLLVPLVARHAYFLASSERFEDAQAAIGKFERFGGSAAVANRVRSDAAGFYRGDYSEAARFGLAALAADPQTPLAAGTLAQTFYMLGMPGEAKKHAQHLPLYTRLGLTGPDALLGRVRRDGPRIWEQSDADVAIRAFAEQRDWGALEGLFDADPGVVNRICANPRPWVIDYGLNLAQALQARGREHEGGALLTCIERVLATQSDSELRSSYLPYSMLSLTQARIAALRGQGERAFDLLNRAISDGFRTRYGAGLGEYPEFDRYRNSQDYRRVDARLKQLIAAERAEVLRGRKPIG